VVYDGIKIKVQIIMEALEQRTLGSKEYAYIIKGK